MMRFFLLLWENPILMLKVSIQSRQFCYGSKSVKPDRCAPHWALLKPIPSSLVALNMNCGVAWKNKMLLWGIWRYPHWRHASASEARRAALGKKKRFAYTTSKVLLLWKWPFNFHILFLLEMKKNWYSNPKRNHFSSISATLDWLN